MYFCAPQMVSKWCSQGGEKATLAQLVEQLICNQ